MEKQWTEQDLHSFVQTAQAVFDSVSLTGSVFVVGSVDTTGPQLAARMQELYEQMPHECITTTGMMHRVQFTMSGAAAGLDEVEAKNWPALYELCDARLRKVQASGGDRIGCAE